MFWRLFLQHPHEVGESYLGHQRAAFGFAGALLAAGLACLIHGLVPGLFVRTGSNTVARLHVRLAARQKLTATPGLETEPLVSR